MKIEFWLENWKNNKIGFHQQETNKHLISYWQLVSGNPNCRVFVPLCGKSLDLMWLREQGHSVLGVEVSERAVNDFFSENGLSASKQNPDKFLHCETERLTILQGDFFHLTANHVQDVKAVFDRASLIALPIELRQKYAQHLKNILPDTAKILLVTFEYDQADMGGPPYSVNEAEVEMLYQDTYKIEQLYAQEVLDSYSQFRASGLKSLMEKVFLLKPY
jgi:thiopurine S-methyltransferase